jgi:hypothetical protein
MKLLNTILMCLAIGLAPLTAAAPTVGDDHVMPYDYSSMDHLLEAISIAF